MRIVISILLLLISFSIHAQEEHSLLWEISGNDLTESSYLYGTMHVSKKVAFRLDDVFYEALDQSDIIALESDPSTWLSNEERSAFEHTIRPKGFYVYPFIMKSPEKKDLATHLAFKDRLVNNILYRSNEFSQDFEEDTYLDMFIYQAGQKFKKPVVALEDLEESSALVGRASLNSMKQKPDEWLQKKMLQQDPMFLMEDAYRERNINLLDSIDQAIYTDHYLENMLYIRNENMAHRLDSVMQTGKVFTGIGAAHLPGKEGVISLLRSMGYTVKALASKATIKGKELKRKFEDKIRTHTYERQAPDDDFFSIQLPDQLYPVADYDHTTYVSPDLANVSYVVIKRIPTYTFLKKGQGYAIADMDELLFENIPGKIIEKTAITKGGFKGLDIKNRLKNGDDQRYQIYMTPLEILIFKMAGDGSYVTQHSDTIFNSIRFRETTKNKVLLSSGYKDFEVLMPSLYRFPNQHRKGNRSIESYDPETNSYYFLRKATLNDFNFIEEDDFELKQIQKRFYQGLKLHPTYEEPKGKSLLSQAVFDAAENRNIYLKTVFNGGDYYLMGVVTGQPNKASIFFNSFKLKAISYPEEFKKIKDTALLFTTVSTIKPSKFVENSNSYYTSKNKPKPYNAYSKKTRYQNKNNETIDVTLNKSHDYLMFSTIDSVWALRKQFYAKKKFHIGKTQTRKHPEGYYELQLQVTNTGSSRGILIKNIVKDGLLYEIKAVVDTIDEPSPFVQNFFDHFKPKDTLLGKSILADKTGDFFTALRANDSIVIDGYRYINFEKRHVDSLKHYISNFKYPDDKKHIQAHLIHKLGQLNDPNIAAFFTDFYEKSFTNSGAQTKILQSVAKNSDGTSVKLLLQLMAQDLPLAYKAIDIQKIFKPFRDSLPLAKKLFPELLDYSAIEEYKSPIFSILAQLKSKKYIRPNSYKKFKKQLLNDANIQLKRVLGKQTNSGEQQRYNNSVSRNKILEDYVVLLHPFIQEKEVQHFFDRLACIKDPYTNTSYATLQAKAKKHIPSSIISALGTDINSRIILFNNFKAIDKLQLIPHTYRTQKAIAEAQLYKGKLFRPKIDSIRFVTQKELKIKEKEYTGYYFIVKDAKAYSPEPKLYLLVYENTGEVSSKPLYTSKGLFLDDTNSQEEAIDLVTEAFILKNRKRTIRYRPEFGGQNRVSLGF